MNIWNSTLLPPDHLADIKNTIERATAEQLLGGENSVFATLQKQFGKYLPQLLRDLELDQTGMKQVFDFMNMGDVTTATKILDGIQNKKDIENGLKKVETDWKVDVEDVFTDAFNEVYKEALRSHPKLYASLDDAT